MGLETFEFIDSLDTANPAPSDLKSEGDDHLRGIKTALKNTFPNVTGEVTASQTELNNLVDSLGAIDASITGDAVDIFIYDTSKDSDGGEWRKRTQHTSWYNEPLNSNTRGSRKEFPAVAVIVAEVNKVTIYDADDSTLPMWMVFNATHTLLVRANIVTSISMKNGVLVAGAGIIGLSRLDFVSEKCLVKTSGGYTFPNQSISFRNTAQTTIAIDGTAGIVNSSINDIAMTVLPDAPIDPATGIQIPTIAVATDGGTSVIKDDGSVVDLTYTVSQNNNSGHVAFTERGGIMWSSRLANTGYVYLVEKYAIPTSDDATVQDNIYSDFAQGVSRGLVRLLGTTGINHIANPPNTVGNAEGLTLIKEDTTPDTGSVAYITSKYSTGYMQGDIRGSWNVDTGVTSLDGTELITNGNFDTDISGWSGFTDPVLSRETTIFTNGGLKVTSSDGESGQHAFQVVSGLVSGNQYAVSTNVYSPSSNSRGSVGTIGLETNSFENRVTVQVEDSIELIQFTFTATSTSQAIRLMLLGATNWGINGDFAIFDNVSVRLAVPDRSVKGNGLAVHGTLDVDPVATGAELKAVSGFNTNNYLEQPYNPDLDFGTGDFYMMGWVKANSPLTNTTYFIIDRAKVGGTFNESSLNLDITGPLRFVILGGTQVIGTSIIANNQWRFFTVGRWGDVARVYVNGILEASAPDTADLTNSDNHVLWIGNRESDTARALDGDLALLRIGAGAPTDEQIKEIYEEEKFLFQENAQCTLNGDSDAVQALAYDDTTELLHVGTAGGRSVFQGLRRVDETSITTTNIAAQDNLIVEETGATISTTEIESPNIEAPSGSKAPSGISTTDIAEETV